MHLRVRHLLPALCLAVASCGAGDDGQVETAGGGDPPVAADSAASDTAGPAAGTDEEVGGEPTTTETSGQQASEETTTPADTQTGEADGPAQGDGSGGTPASVPADSLVTLTARLDSLLAGQERLARRIDSLSGTSADAASDDDTAPTEVLGEAGRSVQSFTIAIVLSVLVIILFNFLIRGVVWVLDALAERNARRRLFYKRLVPIIRIVLWVLAAYLIVRVIFRIDAQGLFAAAAAIGVAVGFAAQDLLKNLFGGLILVFDQPFQVGDKVSVGDTYGEVKSIGLRSTRIVTADDNLVSVPNAQVVDQQVANANAGELHCQVVTDLYLPGWADEETAKRIAFDAASTSKYVYLNKPIVVLVSDQFKETFLTRIRVKAYVLDPRFEFLFQSDITERARTGFREAGLLRPEHMRPYLVEHSGISGMGALTADRSAAPASGESPSGVGSTRDPTGDGSADD